MSLEEEVDLLRNIPFFAKIAPARLKLLAFASQRLTYGAGQDLFRQGEIGDAAYIIIEGRADVVVDGPDGEVKVADLGVNDLVGEIAILCDVPRTATVRALTPTVVEMVTGAVLSQELNTMKPWMSMFVRTLADRFRERDATE